MAKVRVLSCGLSDFGAVVQAVRIQEACVKYILARLRPLLLLAFGVWDKNEDVSGAGEQAS